MVKLLDAYFFLFSSCLTSFGEAVAQFNFTYLFSQPVQYFLFLVIPRATIQKLSGNSEERSLAFSGSLPAAGLFGKANSFAVFRPNGREFRRTLLDR